MAEIAEDCKSCGLYLQCHSPYLGGKGSKSPMIMFVGESPGSEEDMRGECFVGAPGKELMKIIAGLEIPEDVCRFNNVVQCRPPMNKTEKNHVKFCRPFIWRDLDETKPKVIVVLGALALFSLTGKSSITAARGAPLPFEYSDGTSATIIPTFHPAFGMRSPSAVPVIARDIKLAWDIAQTGSVPEPAPCVYQRVQSEEDWDAVLAACDKAEIVSFDIETTALNPRKEGSKIVCFQISTEPRQGFLFLLEHDETLAGERMANIEFLQWLFTNKKLTGHNLKFDLGFVKAIYGIEAQHVEWDSCIAQHLIDENATQFGGSGLKECAKSYTDKGGYDEKVEKEFGKSIYDSMQSLPIPHLLAYACGDTDVAIRVYDAQQSRIESDNLTKAFEFERDVKLPFIMKLEEEGVCIDWKLRDKLQDKYEGRLEVLVRKLQDYPEVRLASGESNSFNPNSPVQVRKLCFDVLKLPKFKDDFFYTDTGQHSVGRAVIDEWLDLPSTGGVAGEILNHIVSIKRIGKVIGTYYRPLPDLRCKDGKVHPNFNNINTVTWRLSANEPNVQQLPRDGVEYSKIGDDALTSGDIKKLFIPPGPDYILCEADLAQIELRIAALLSQDAEMLKSFFNPDLDMHRVLAAKVFGVPVEKVTREQRQMAKIANFGAIYLITAESLAKKLRISEKQADKFLKEFFRIFKGYDRWSSALEMVIKDQAYVEGLFGHKRHLPNVKLKGPQGAAAVREGINFPIQNTASNMTIFAGYHAAKEFEAKNFDAKFTMSVHDSLIWWCRKDQVSETAQIVLKHMEAPLQTYFPGIEKQFKKLPPIKAEVKIGPNWGEMKVVEHFL